MTRPPALDARILDKLAQVVAIVRHNGWGTQADVWRVAIEHLGHRAPNPRAEAAERRAEAAERKAERLAAQIAAMRLDAIPEGHRVAYLPRRQIAVLNEAAKGTPRPQIADLLGVTKTNLSTLLKRAAQGIGAADTGQAIALVAAGRVQLQPKTAA